MLIESRDGNLPGMPSRKCGKNGQHFVFHMSINEKRYLDEDNDKRTCMSLESPQSVQTAHGGASESQSNVDPTQVTLHKVLPDGASVANASQYCNKLKINAAVYFILVC